MSETGAMRRFAGVCGEYCLSCANVQEGQCRGCAYQLGQPPRGECPIYQCAQAIRGLEHCGLCPDYPCQIFLEAAEATRVQRRMSALRRRLEIGTERWLMECKA